MTTLHVYNRCGSCRHFQPRFTDRMGRAMGTCLGKPTHPDVSGSDFGCPEYHLERARLMPGTPVPEDADLSPRQRELAKRQAQMQAAQTSHRSDTPRRTETSQRPAAVARRPAQHIDLSLDDDEETPMQRQELKAILAEVLDEALGTADAPIHPRFAGGKVVIQPANAELQAKEVDIDVFFRKIVSVREKLRVLEQKVNSSDKLDSADKVQIQQYITSCYGSLTSFNFLFRDRDDWFVGESSK